MKICIVSNYRKNGYGESSRPYFLSINLHKQGHQILHLCEHEGNEDGIEYMKVQTWVWEPSFIKRIITFMYLFYKVRTFGPDVIYMHQFNNARWALASRVMPKVKFVFDAHTSLYFEARGLTPEKTDDIERVKNIERDICQKTDAIIAASEETRQILQEAYSLPGDKLYVVGNATYISPVTEAEKTVANSTPRSSFTCLATLPFDGFLSNELALARLFEIAALVQDKINIKFVVLGGGQKPVAPTANIIYAGYVPDLRKEILAADICLMPYPDNAVCGGARNKFCDFIALGKVVVSSPEGMRGMQALEPGKNCLVANNKNEFATQIIELSESVNKVRALENEVFKMREYYNWKDRAGLVAGIFKKLLDT
jgi:hypothetical protein